MARTLDTRQLQLETTSAEPPSHGVHDRDPDHGWNGRNVRGQARAPSTAAELLKTPGALLTRTHLRGLGLERRAVDAVFRLLPVVALPGYSRPMVRADDYVELVERNTYRDDRVRPIG